MIAIMGREKTDGRSMRYEGFDLEQLKKSAMELGKAAGVIVKQCDKLLEAGETTLEIDGKKGAVHAFYVIEMLARAAKGRVAEISDL